MPTVYDLIQKLAEFDPLAQVHFILEDEPNEGDEIDLTLRDAEGWRTIELRFEK